MPLSWANAFFPTMALLYCTGKACDPADHIRRAIKVLWNNIALIGQRVAAHAQRHDHLFQRRVACPLAEAINRAFYLARTI